MKRIIWVLIVATLGSPVGGLACLSIGVPGCGSKEKELDTVSTEFPKNLEECFIGLKKNLPKKELEKFRNTKEDKAAIRAHRGLGMWIRNEWIRNRPWETERPLRKYFNDMGIFHPDDMSSIILTSFHRHLNNRDIKLEQQVKYYQEYWKKVREGKKKE